MDSSPSKRRKTSPTTSIPVDAPTTPSRIPIRKDGTQPVSGRPSFASPTKASLSRHNPQLLRRPSSAGTGTERQSGGGNDLEGLFGKAFLDVRPSTEGGSSQGTGELGSTTQGSNDLSQEPPRQTTPKRARSVGGGLSAKPRRMSRSPLKQAPKTIEPDRQEAKAVEEMQENINPFQKAGLRRSPVGALHAGILQDLEKNPNPFEKRGLRRSPRSLQPVDGLGKSPERTEALPESSTTTTDIAPSQTAESPVLSNPIAAHEPIASISQPQTVQEEVPVQLSNVERHEQPPLAPDITEQPRASKAVEALTFRNLEPQSQQDGPVNPERQTRSSKPAEPATLNRRAGPEEPDLPPTPTQLGLADPIVTTPPTGIHDTPSRRARKKAQKLKSSPLKPRDPPPPPEPSQTAEVESQPKANNDGAIKRRRSVRFLIPEDPHASKKKARDDLLKELQQLQADVTLANQENERLRLHYDSRRSAPAEPSNSDELLDMLLRSTALEPVTEPKTKPSVFKCIDSFLPFSSRRKHQAVSLPTLKNATPSYLPIALDDPLPYLQAFSPLAYTSHITLLPSETTSLEASSEAADQPILQRHQIKASHPSGLFSARFSMIVDSSLLSINSLHIEKLPSSADKELGIFMRERSSAETVLNRDIGVVCWAMGRWVEVSALRARFWCAVESEFGTPEAREISLQRVVHRRKRKRRQVINEEDTTTGLDGNDEDEDEETRKAKWTTRQLLPHMGRTAMEIGNDHVELRFEWSIGFDWTGEVESSISASARIPKSWQKQDDRKSLKRIPESFDKLVKERGPLSAVRTVVGLLMPAS